MVFWGVLSFLEAAGMLQMPCGATLTASGGSFQPWLLRLVAAVQPYQPNRKESETCEGELTKPGGDRDQDSRPSACHC